MSGDILIVTTAGRELLGSGGGRRPGILVSIDPTVHRTPPTTENCLTQNSVMLSLGNPDLKQDTFLITLGGTLTSSHATLEAV